jgi:hypothetical protein
MTVSVGLSSKESTEMLNAFSTLVPLFRRATGFEGIDNVLLVCNGIEVRMGNDGTWRRLSGEISGWKACSTYSQITHKIKGDKMMLVDSKMVKVLHSDDITEDEIALISKLIDRSVAIVKKAMNNGKQQELFDAVVGMADGLKEMCNKNNGEMYIDGKKVYSGTDQSEIINLYEDGEYEEDA